MNTFVWLTWRQHRWTILATASLALLAAFTLVSTEGGKVGSMMMAGFYGLLAQLLFGGVISMFWGAPLIARELEERTYFVAWGQDVTPTKWLRGKMLVLGPLAVLLGALVGLGDGFGGPQESWGMFEASPFVQGGYAIFGLALGVFIGLLSRHVVTAMAATLVFYTLARVLPAVLLRDHYLPSKRDIARWESTPVVPHRGLEIGNGFVGADLRPVSVPDKCAELPNPNSCMRNTKTAIGTYVDYQPIERLGLFQFIEFIVFVLLAGVLFAVTFRLLRRGGGWKPSRSHRRIDSVAEPAQTVQSTPDTAAAHAEG
ncbi:hypothetical protein FXN61_12965 [Lentzea sp. PSKA42]|uniref:ABC-2 family transporter protein n=1 Tax=Lentzea indica TaxID=2604800 RepID=A0ABX1FGD8_9PSEU|nr:hypothetical protein [Lentzea indica]NKE57697.1 hypothetical protein [Lentzea indica]